MFEDLVKAVFAAALEAVANESGRPAEKDTAETFFGVYGPPGGDVGGVDFGVDLPATFHLWKMSMDGSFEIGWRTGHTRSRGVTDVWVGPQAASTC